jgi:hypothetical protein
MIPSIDINETSSDLLPAPQAVKYITATSGSQGCDASDRDFFCGSFRRYIDKTRLDV